MFRNRRSPSRGGTCESTASAGASDFRGEICSQGSNRRDTTSSSPIRPTSEPRLALAGGRDGLEFVRRILLAARDFLRPGGLLVVEIGHNRSRLERAFPRLPFIWPETSAGCDCVFLLSREDLPE